MKLKLLGAAVVLVCAAVPAHAVGRLADVLVVDRSSGAVLPVIYHRGEYWVAGKPGAKYAVSVRNRLGERVMAVASVDGVNVLSGETASWDQTGYVFSAYRHYQITGWRKSSSEVAAFEFSDAGDSYAGRTGRPANVGVIGVALFREKLPEPVARAPEIYPPASPDTEPSRMRPGNAGGLADHRLESQTQAQPPNAPSFAERRAKAADAQPAPRLGTAHGERETSVVSHTSFERLQALPSEVIRIRYDSRENLVASGVIRAPAVPAPNPAANPFPLSDQATYVPDPPARRY